jgi:hypothetical protein
MGATAIATFSRTKTATDRAKMGKSLNHGSMGFYLEYVGQPEQYPPSLQGHGQVIRNMDIIDLSIIEEWHAGADDLMPIDRMQWKGITLEELLAKRSRYRRDWLSFVQTARTAMDPLAEGEEYD